MDKSKRHLAWWVVGLLAVAAVVAWWLLRPAGVPEGFAVSNGRIEATEVDIASKIAGRIDTILVKEGQFVREGEVLAKMDTRVLQEQRLEAIAQIKEAESAVAAAALRNGELLRVLPGHAMHQRTIYALYPSRRYLDAKIRTWVEFLKMELPKMPWLRGRSMVLPRQCP